jgi:hypothetical protein
MMTMADSGVDVTILKILSPKNFSDKIALFTQITAI